MTHNERGAALILVLLLTMLVTVIGGALIVMTSAEHLITAHDRDAEALFHAADAGLDRAILELGLLADWTAVLDGRAVSRVRDGTLTPRLADGRMLSLPDLTAEIQAASHRGPWGPDTPRWRLFVYGDLGRLTALGHEERPWPYVVVWVADDHTDGDSEPLRDANETLALRSDAFGARHGRRGLEMTVTRPDPYPSALRVLSWRVSE